MSLLDYEKHLNIVFRVGSLEFLCGHLIWDFPEDLNIRINSLKDSLEGFIERLEGMKSYYKFLKVYSVHEKSILINISPVPVPKNVPQSRKTLYYFQNIAFERFSVLVRQVLEFLEIDSEPELKVFEIV